MSSRRKLLKTGILIGGAALVGGGFYYRDYLDDRKLALLLTSFLDYPDLAQLTGKRLLESDASMNITSLDQSFNDLLISEETSRSKISKLTQDSLLQNLHQRIELDFVEENIVIVDGWILSLTEARLCVLAFVCRDWNV